MNLWLRSDTSSSSSCSSLSILSKSGFPLKLPLKVEHLESTVSCFRPKSDMWTRIVLSLDDSLRWHFRFHLFQIIVLSKEKEIVDKFWTLKTTFSIMVFIFYAHPFCFIFITKAWNGFGAKKNNLGLNFEEVKTCLECSTVFEALLRTWSIPRRNYPKNFLPETNSINYFSL